MPKTDSRTLGKPKVIRLETLSLLLRPYQSKDREFFMALNCDPEVRRHMNGPMTELAAGQRFDGMLAGDSADQSFCWAIVEKETSTFVGHAFLQRVDDHMFPELGFLFFKSFWGRGYATEVTCRLVEHCLSDCDLRGLSATVDCDHAPSIRVLEKAGFKEERVATDELGPFFVYSIQRSNSRRLTAVKC